MDDYDETRERIAPKLEVQQADGDEGCASFLLYDEDHTIGNSLRAVLIRDPRVEFCGYHIPHPSEKNIVLKLQTRKNIEDGEKTVEAVTSAVSVLEDGLVNLDAIFSTIEKKFRDEAGIQNDEKTREISNDPVEMEEE